MSRLVTYLYWLPLVAGAALPRMTEESASLAVRNDDRTIIANPDTGRTFVPGETSTDRTIYNAVALFCAIVLAVFLGFRLKTLRNNVLRKRNFTSMLVVVLFIFGLGFIICASVVQTGQGLRTHQLCYASAMICLVFYTGNKLTIYIFLLERARVVRAPFMPRLKDRVWLLGMFIICGGFGTIAIIGYMSPVVELSSLDGRCRIGLPPRVSFPLLCFDVAVNFLLTGVFFWLLRPVLDFHGLLKASTWCGEKATSKLRRSIRKREVQAHISLEGASLKSAMNRNIKTLLWKCLIGSTLVMLPTVANMTQFYIMDSRELGWVCLTICTLDVSWGVIVVNWLTIGSAEAESNLTTLMSQRTLPNGHASKPDPISHFDIGLIPHKGSSDNEDPQELATRTRQASATTAEVPVFYKAASLKDEGGLLRSDGVRESWNLETGLVGGHTSRDESLIKTGGDESIGLPRLKEPERTWGESSRGWAEGSKMWITVNDRVVRGRDSEESLGTRRLRDGL
ncbi:hypothetical protein E8E12_010091 [Didymella heteroderae]|uniref:G-protein coupled receptors family 2 profile 2 domain-containing protein n=1 Tax=Didymella heteroderae TaxID=1769908 RepID=A0A9P5C3A2_9PLEO|nr:hypothetical protein E8E12_010091 [Didymella heteroderae]